MLPLDVESSFINVPLTERVGFTIQYLTEKVVISGIPVTKQDKLIVRCLWNEHFLYDERYYRPKDDVAMGSPLGLIFTDIFLVRLEHGQLLNLL